MRKRFHLLVMLAAIIATCVFFARADSITPAARGANESALTLGSVTYTVDVPLGQGVWNGTVSHETVHVPQLPVSVGRAYRVTIANLTFKFVNFVGAENTSKRARAVLLWFLFQSATLRTQDGTEVGGASVAWTLPPWILAPFDGVVDFRGPSGRHRRIPGYGRHDEPTVIQGVRLAPYAGEGTIPFDLERGRAFAWNRGGNWFGAVYPYSSAQFTITYDYVN